MTLYSFRNEDDVMKTIDGANSSPHPTRRRFCSFCILDYDEDDDDDDGDDGDDDSARDSGHHGRRPTRSRKMTLPMAGSLVTHATISLPRARAVLTGTRD